MANRDDVRRHALAFPETTEGDGDLLGVILTDAWLIRAPRRLGARLAADAERPAY